MKSTLWFILTSRFLQHFSTDNWQLPYFNFSPFKPINSENASVNASSGEQHLEEQMQACSWA
jgi:hypothetical protein